MSPFVFAEGIADLRRELERLERQRDGIDKRIIVVRRALIERGEGQQ